MPTPEISVIIPTLNEEENIGATLRSCLLSGPHEIIVVDGGSQDHTRDIASKFPVSYIETSPGRARQMNAGAALAAGRHLLFLHADTLLPTAWPDEVQNLLSIPFTAAGAFRLRIAERSFTLGMIEGMVNWRSKFLGLPYGDQGLFVESALFRHLGGFADLPILEDFEFVSRLRKVGKIRLSNAAVETSARRWKKLGPLKTTLINQFVVWGYLLGVSPERLAAVYRRGDES